MRELVAIVMAVAMSAVVPGGDGRAAEAARVLVLADTPPFSYRAGGELRGFNVDVAAEICRRLDLDCRLDESTLGDILDAVADGRAEIGMANLLMTRQRAGRVLFSMPLWRSSSSYVARRDGGPPKEHARLAVVAGSVQAEYLYRTFPRASVLEVPSTAASLRMVEEGEADYTLLPIAVASEIVRRSARLILTGERVYDQALGGTVHIILPPGRDDLKVRVDDAIAAMLADGGYFKISRRYFPFDLH